MEGSVKFKIYDHPLRRYHLLQEIISGKIW